MNYSLWLRDIKRFYPSLSSIALYYLQPPQLTVLSHYSPLSTEKQEPSIYANIDNTIVKTSIMDNENISKSIKWKKILQMEIE